MAVYRNRRRRPWRGSRPRESEGKARKDAQSHPRRVSRLGEVGDAQTEKKSASESGDEGAVAERITTIPGEWMASREARLNGDVADDGAKLSVAFDLSGVAYGVGNGDGKVELGAVAARVRFCSGKGERDTERGRG